MDSVLSNEVARRIAADLTTLVSEAEKHGTLPRIKSVAIYFNETELRTIIKLLRSCHGILDPAQCGAGQNAASEVQALALIIDPHADELDDCDANKLFDAARRVWAAGYRNPRAANAEPLTDAAGPVVSVARPNRGLDSLDGGHQSDCLTPAEGDSPPYEDLRKTNVELMAKLRDARAQVENATKSLAKIEEIAGLPISGTSLQQKANRFDRIREIARNGSHSLTSTERQDG